VISISILTYLDRWVPCQTTLLWLDKYDCCLPPGGSLYHNCRWLSAQTLFFQCD